MLAAACALLSIVLLSSAQAASPAREYFEAGERAARMGDSFRAYFLYAKAASLEPLNTAYAARKHALETSVALTRPAEVEPATVRVSADPAIETGTADLEAQAIANGELTALGAALEPVRLRPNPGKQSLKLRGDGQSIWSQTAAAFGVQISFDRNYQALPNLRLELNDVDATQAFRILEAATDSFGTAIDEKQIIVARDTPDRRTELTPTMAMAVPIPQRLSVQEAQELLTAVQQIVEVRRVSLDAGKRVAYFRDTAVKALAARKMFNDLSKPRAQVEVDIEFLTFSKSSSLNYGLSLPTSSALVDFGSLPANIQIPTAPAGVGFAAFGGGASTIGLGITQSSIFALMAKNSTQLRLSTNLVAADGQATTLHIGDRYPVITNSFSGFDKQSNANAGALASGIQFVDLGLMIKMTPTVHAESEVTLELETSFKTLGALGANKIPEIGSREYQGRVRLKAGEWAVIAGLMNTGDSETPVGVAGLAQLPLLGGLFRHNVHVREVGETLIVLKPRIVILPAWESVIRPMWTGTEARPLSTF